MPQKRQAEPTSRDENPSAFKHSIGPELLKRLAKEISAVHPAFDSKKFLALKTELAPLELKARVNRVREELRLLLPADYKKSLSIILASVENENLKSFDLWPFTDFIQTYGLDNRKASLDGLKVLTRLFTAEFAVRPFIRLHSEETLAYLLKCAKSSNVHDRRWASEGSRPRLPWGERLTELVKDPAPTLPILEELKFDGELYVRKSVANHLNDIAKDHPDFVIKVLSRWAREARSKEEKERGLWITKHALRSLIKAGNPKALQCIGVDASAKIKVRSFKLEDTVYNLGERMSFAIELQSEADRDQKLVVDYSIHYMKANGKTSPKVFKWKTFDLKAGERLKLSKVHVLKEVTTRVHYSGKHALSVQVNGVVVKTISWDLST